MHLYWRIYAREEVKLLNFWSFKGYFNLLSTPAIPQDI